MDAGVWPPLRRSWYLMAILMLLHSMSYIDRNIIALLAEPISGSLSISDTKLGVLYGLGFGILYAVVAIPLGRLVDRTVRIRIVAGGVTLWSLCTVLSGLAHSFEALVVLRSGVAIGEAVLSPAAVSLIPDLFAKDRRTLPTAAFGAVPIVMASGAYAIGGLVLDAAATWSAVIAPWRLTLIIVGVPGLALALILLLTGREPPRQTDAQGLAPDDQPSIRDTVAFLVREGRLFGLLYLGLGFAYFLLYGYQAWVPTLMIRGYGFSTSEAGYVVGVFGLLAGIAGIVFWSVLARRFFRLDREHMILPLFALAAAMMGLSALVTGLARNEVLVVAALCGVNFAASAFGVFASLIVQLVGPPRLRGLLVAMNILPSSLFGMALGSTVIGALSETLYRGDFALGSAMGLVAAVATPICALSFALATRGYLWAVRRRELNA